jgi:hypothetical protein
LSRAVDADKVRASIAEMVTLWDRCVTERWVHPLLGRISPAEKPAPCGNGPCSLSGPPDFPLILNASGWHERCCRIGVVTRLRASLSAVALVAAILSASGTLLAAADHHPVCAAKHHDCGRAPTIGSCCCGDQGRASDGSVPAEPRVQLVTGLSFVSIAPLPTVIDLQSAATARVQTSPPRGVRPDLPTLFATLLI